MNHNHSYQYHILSCRIASCHSYAISYTIGMYQIVILGTDISGSCTYHKRSVCTRQRYLVLSFRVPIHNFAYITDIISINILSNTQTCKHIYIYDQMLLTVHFPRKQSSSPVLINIPASARPIQRHIYQFTVSSNSLFYVQMQFMYIMFYCFTLFIHVIFYPFIINAFLRN